MAQAEAQRYNTLAVGTVHVHRNPQDALYCPICQAQAENRRRADRAATDAAAAEARYRAQQQIADRARAEIPQPDWMMDFGPIDPSAPMATLAPPPATLPGAEPTFTPAVPPVPAR